MENISPNNEYVIHTIIKSVKFEDIAINRTFYTDEYHVKEGWIKITRNTARSVKNDHGIIALKNFYEDSVVLVECAK